MTDRTPDLTAALGSRYRIERELGSGGMATVYLAEDVRHHRRVAIKVLKPDLAAAIGTERFLREITTTANLRHPHIVPLYDSGEGDGVLCYIMPFVEGESLRDRLTREKQLPLRDALRIAREVADALQYAHAHGVIHRDIKPENILLESGHAVVADFGIAQAIDVAGNERLTGTGVAIGTPAYMSPEQVAGERDLDARSDLYALACVLYEMLAGQPPFVGPTSESVFHQHILAPPPPITILRSTVPADVATALQRALSKAPADRYTAVSEFAAALAIAEDSADRPALAPKPAARSRWMPLAGALVVAAVVVAGILLAVRRTPAPILLGRRTPVTTDPGLELDPALSPDGRLVAYSARGGALMVRQVDGGAPVQVARADDVRGRWPAWLPDGQRLVFISPRGIELVSALGGVPRLLVGGTELDRGVAVAPDGGTVAYVSHDSLLAVPVNGGTARLVTRGYEMHSPAWSPDGRWIAFVQGDKQYINISDLGNLAQNSIWLAPGDGGTAHRVSDELSMHASPAWASARSLLYVADADGGRDVYRLALTSDGEPRGAPLRISTGLNPHGISVSLGGARLAYSAFTETSNVWSLPIPAAGDDVSVSTAVPETRSNELVENIGVSIDGKWLGYSAGRGRTSQVYRMRLGTKGVEPQQLTSDSNSSYWAAFSPDAKELAFHRFRGERRQVIVASAEGGAETAVTDGSEDERAPEWSPDGRQLLLLASWSTGGRLHIVTRGSDGKWSKPRELPLVVGGSKIVVTGVADWSPDGRWVACGCGEGGIVVAPVGGGPARRLTSPFSTAGWAFPQWSADGRTVYHVTEDSGRTVAVVGVPVDGGAARAVVRFDDPTRPWHRYGFRVRAGRIFLTLGDRESDVWVTDIERK